MVKTRLFAPIEKGTIKKVHTRKRNKKEYVAGSRVDYLAILKDIEKTIKLVEHYLKKTKKNET